ncbi:MAG: threonylcarbamoyl-AMP synthase [Ruminococcaceae bacterium]|nr:threonylcarbamoyl-AMP synthase [Oscillospiraceae bacterium]
MNTEIIYDINDENLDRAAEIIKNGGLVAFPTETVYGLGANALDPLAAKKIYSAKNRPSNNPLIIHISDPADAEKYCFTNELYYKLAKRFMPGPLTVILPKKDIVPYAVTGGLETVAVRVPSSKTARSFIERSGVAIAAPSANLSGKPSPTKAQHVILDMYGRIDMIIAGEDSQIGLESTILSLAEAVPKIYRPGKVTYEELKEICPDILISDAVLHMHTGRPESPGMMYQHYAPKAKVTIIDSDDKTRTAFLINKTDCGILCYDEDKELLSMPYSKSLGSKSEPLEQAKLLFARLREFDENDDITQIYAPMPSDKGVGLAVLNRLIRAAGFDVKEL